NHTIRLGGYFDGERAEIDNHESVFPVPPGGGNPRSFVDNIALTAWQYSVYLQDEWKPIEKLTVNYGVRFDLYDGLTRSDQASPRVGAEYRLFKNTTLHAAYARYFTPPATELVPTASFAKVRGTTGAPAIFKNDTPSPE